MGRRRTITVGARQRVRELRRLRWRVPLSERPEHQQPRRLTDWLNLTGARKAHSLIDKVYKRKNLELAWKKVKANKGAGGIDGESIEAFDKRFEERLSQLHDELKTDSYRPRPVRQRPIPKLGQPNEQRMLGIPTIYDRVCQQALVNGWNRSLSRYSTKPTSDIGEGDLRRMHYVRCGRRSRLGTNGSSTRI